MILDRIEHLDRYEKLGRNLRTAIDFVRNRNLDDIPAGTFEIDGADVFAVSTDKELESVPELWEVHGKYADIHCVVCGHEVIGVCPVERAGAEISFPNGSDVCTLGNLEGRDVELDAGEFLLLLPHEIHRPNCPSPRGKRSKKIIFKVLLG